MLKDQSKSTKYNVKINVIDSKVTEDAVSNNSVVASYSYTFNGGGIKKVVKVNKDLTFKITEINM